MNTVTEKMKKEITNRVRDWAASHDWDIALEKFLTDFDEDDIDFCDVYIGDIEIDETDIYDSGTDTYKYKLEGRLYISAQEEGAPFPHKIMIVFQAEGIIAHHRHSDDWEIANPVNIAPEIKYWDGNLTSDLIQKTTIDSAEELIKFMPSSYEDYWYRGHACHKWKLRPGIARKDEQSFYLAKELRLEFEKEIAFLGSDFQNLDIAKSNFLMQHYGVPTRLLDWTTASTVAMYFAVFNKEHDDDDACVWVLDPAELNDCHSKPFPYKLAGEEQEVFSDESDWTYALYNTYADLRMKSQKSEFTVHSGYVALDDTPKAATYLKKKIIIPSRIKPDVRDRLESMGVVRSSLFPDLGNIATGIREKFWEGISPEQSEDKEEDDS